MDEYKKRLAKIYLSQANASSPYAYNPVRATGYVGGGIVALQQSNITYPSGTDNGTEAISIKHAIKKARSKNGGLSRFRDTVPAHIPGDYSEYINRVSRERMYENAKNFVPIAPGVETIVDQSDYLAEQANEGLLPHYAGGEDIFYTSPEDVSKEDIYEIIPNVRKPESLEDITLRENVRAGFTPSKQRALAEVQKKAAAKRELFGEGFVRDTSQQTSAPARAIKTKPESRSQRELYNLERQLHRSGKQSFKPISYQGLTQEEQRHNDIVAQAQHKAYLDLRKKFTSIKEREKLKELFSYL